MSGAIEALRQGWCAARKDAVEGGLFGDLLALARVAEASVGDLEARMLLDAVALDDLADR